MLNKIIIVCLLLTLFILFVTYFKYVKMKQHFYLGSPPHVRERHELVCVGNIRFGITPACAGKTYGLPTCGTCATGSPPHVRERQIPWLYRLYVHRITPACAGKTVAAFKNGVWFQDHPRMCGKD